MTLHILWKAFSSHLFLWQTGCEWHCTFWAVSAHLFLWPTDGEWHCTLCGHQSHHIFSLTNREWVTLHILCTKAVSSHSMPNSLWVALYILGSLITFFLWPTVCEWHCTFSAISSHLFVSPTGCEWYYKFSTLLFPQLLNVWNMIHHYILCISESEHTTIPFSMSLFYIIIDCKISLRLTHSHNIPLTYCISLSLISRWVILLHQVLIFIPICMSVCRSDVYGIFSRLYLITRMNFSPCLERWKKANL